MADKSRSFKQCIDCHEWGDCIGRDFYTPEELQYCFNQVIWLIGEFIDLEGDNIVVERETWPIPDSGYTEAAFTTGSIMPYASYVKVREITADISSRLKNTGPAGKLLIDEVHRSLKYLDFSSEARWALKYVSGERPKRQTFSQWKADKTAKRQRDQIKKTPSLTVLPAREGSLNVRQSRHVD